MTRIKPKDMDWWTWRNGSQCKPTKNQKEIDACPSNVCSCYAYAVREEEDAKTANAHLIAAAPDLLEAVEDLLRDIPIKHRPIESFKKAIEATRKAKGEL